MDYLVATYDYVSVSSIGESYEGRDMRVRTILDVWRMYKL